MSHALDGCNAKLARADELHDYLIAQIREWHANDGGRIEGEYRAARCEYVYVAKHRFVHPVTTGLGIDIDGAGTMAGIANWDAGRVLREYWCPSTELPHGTDVVRFRLAPRGPNPVVRLTHEIRLALSFGPRWISPWSLDYIRSGVGRVFEVLGPELDVDQAVRSRRLTPRAPA